MNSILAIPGWVSIHTPSAFQDADGTLITKTLHSTLTLTHKTRLYKEVFAELEVPKDPSSLFMSKMKMKFVPAWI
jgi:hypothetical protein